MLCYVMLSLVMSCRDVLCYRVMYCNVSNQIGIGEREGVGGHEGGNGGERSCCMM